MMANSGRGRLGIALDAVLFSVILMPIAYTFLCYDGSSRTTFGIPSRWVLFLGILLPTISSMNMILLPYAKEARNMPSPRLLLLLIPVIVACSFSIVLMR